jgi:subtilisin family serine protease
VSANYLNDTDGLTASGTSMSSPLVSGAAALYLQGHPGASPAAVTAAIVSMSTPNVIGGLPRSCNVLLQLLGGCPGYKTPNRLLYTGGGPIITPPPPKPCNQLAELLGWC